jgi:MYXO-CTERM domain-containing protein
MIAWIFPTIVHAFCGFYVSSADTKLENDATRVVLMRDQTRTVLSMQNAYKGPVEAFAMVVPVPVVLQKENVKVLGKDIFERVDALSAPRLVEYWEQDPCQTEADKQRFMYAPSRGLGGLSGIGGGTADLGVKIEAKFEVGEYEVVILSAQDSSGLDTWLKSEHYKIPDGAEPYLRPYVEAGSKFFVAKVNPAKVHFEGGRAELSPLRFHYDSDQFTLPIRLGLLNSGGKQDLEVFILGQSRYEAANAANVFIPTNLDVNDATRANFSGFYASLFDNTLEKNPGAVVTEYSWSPASCDPCPVSPLTKEELATLGADVIPSSVWGEPGLDRNVKGVVQLDPATFTPAPPPQADRVIAATRSRMRACYQRGLRSDPTQTGRLSLSVDIASNGEVNAAKALSNTGLSAEVTSCVTHALLALQFDAPGKPTNAHVNMAFVLDQPQPAPQPNAPHVLLSVPDFTLTRLHTRYAKDALGQDLTFRVAKAIVGGREDRGADGKLSTTAADAQTGLARNVGSNTFQARYAIRHAWSGEVACKEPHRGIWGAPPNEPAPTAAAATKLAIAPRGGVAYASFLGPGSTVGASRASDAGATANADASTPNNDGSTSTAPSAPTQKRGCGCSVIGDSSAPVAPLFALFAFAIAMARRRAK